MQEGILAKDVLADFVVRQARGVLLPDGDAQLLDVRDGVAYVRFKRAHNPKCLDCEVVPEDFRDYLMGMMAEKAPHITDVQLEIQEE